MYNPTIWNLQVLVLVLALSSWDSSSSSLLWVSSSSSSNEKFIRKQQFPTWDPRTSFGVLKDSDKYSQAKIFLIFYQKPNIIQKPFRFDRITKGAIFFVWVVIMQESSQIYEVCTIVITLEMRKQRHRELRNLLNVAQLVHGGRESQTQVI